MDTNGANRAGLIVSIGIAGLLLSYGISLIIAAL